MDQVLTLKAADKDAAKRLMDDIEEQIDADALGMIDVAMVWKTGGGRIHMKYLHDHARLIGAVVGLPMGLLTAGVGYFIGRAYSFHHHEITSMVRDITEHLDAGRAALVVRSDAAGADQIEKFVADHHGEISVDRRTFSPEMDEELARAADQERTKAG